MNQTTILPTLKEAIERHPKEVAQWYKRHCEKANVPFYASIDIRNSGYKIAAIDTNLFPAGFNNIFRRDLQVASTFVPGFLKKKFGAVKKILLVPEEHTRNLGYLKNVGAILRLLSTAGYEVKLGTLSTEMRKDRVELQVGEGETLQLDRAYINGKRLVTNDFNPDVIILNNDFSEFPPEELRQIAQPIEPPLDAGWFSRRKSNHLRHLNRLTEEFCNVIKMDPWLMSAETELVTGVDINEEDSRKRIAEMAEGVLKRVRAKYEQYGVQQEPYLFLKDNSGTYGFAVINVRNPEEILALNSKMRRKMSSGKGKSKVDEILVQEGIPTDIWVGDCPAEPVIYLLGGEVIGGFFRKHCDQDHLQSLNVKGMVFSLLTFTSPLDSQLPEDIFRDDTSLQVYGNLARIAYLATGYELKETVK